MNKHQIQAIFLKHQRLIEQAVNSKNIRISGITADDVIQETSIRILNVINSDRQIDNMSSYIYRTVANVIIDLARKNNKYQTHEWSVEDSEDHTDWQVDEHNPEDQITGHELKDTITAAIESLPESRRIAVKMRLQGYTIAEMSELTGWPYYKAENLSKRSMAALRDKLKKSGIDYEIN